jgi:calcineurin-like phosphoesterase family protein
MATFVTADTHFAHQNIIRHAGRPFSSVDEMDAEILRRWNAVVSPADVVWHLGDFAFKNHESYFDQLNGTKHLVRGNHDDRKTDRLGWASIVDYTILRQQDARIVLFHYPIEEWDGFYRGAIHFHGHQHNTNAVTGRNRRDVGVDAWAFTPVALDTLLSGIAATIEADTVI